LAKVILEGVTKKFDEVLAVNNVNLEIKEREFVVLVGPSGCGKTTTLRMIAGLEEITEGKIYIGDRLINDVPPKDRDIAMVFQNYALYPHMSVYDNMAFGLKLRKIPKKEIVSRVGEAAEILGLEKLLTRLPKQLSGGQRQRVALGRAIVRKPSVFLMDEPLSNLDAKLRVQMRAELKKLHEKLKTTVVYVTHDQVEAMTLGERITVMVNGHVQQADSPLTVYDKPSNRFVAGFIGSPPMNFIDGKIVKKKDGLSFASEDFSIPISSTITDLVTSYIDKKVVLGIRPQDIVEERRAKRIEEHFILDTKVDFRELMGSETYLYLKCGKTPLISRVAALSDAKAGTSYKAVFNLRKIHLFDTETHGTIV
jgi:multiple sugar transport system ATP-binding protein